MALEALFENQFANKGARAIAMRHVLNHKKSKVFLVPFLTTKEASGATLDRTILL